MGSFESLTQVSLSVVYLKAGGKLALNVPQERNVFFYVIRGSVTVNNAQASIHQLVEFDNDAETVSIQTESESILLLGHAKPLNEPVVAQGPFVMNTQEEITQAYQDYRDGRFGTWK